MKVAIVHYWLVGMRGGEKVLEQLCILYPNADIFTHVYDLDAMSDTLKRHNINATFINKLPFAKKYYQTYLPLMPMALEELDLRGYDLVISSESGPAKGVITDPRSLHICYCHSPMRYIWDMYQDYSRMTGFFKRLLLKPVSHYLRVWDVTAAWRVDLFIANSSFISKRIKKFYRRDSAIIFPPVAVDDFDISDTFDDYYLMVGQLVDYKRVDLAVRAFNKTGKRLVVVGGGDQLKKLKRLAMSNVQILGYRDFSTIKKYYSRCRALIFPGLEDFGMVPIEAMASGRPVIAYGKGGALDYVKNGKTGVLFYEQTIESIVLAVEKFEEEGVSYTPEELKAFASKFSAQNFREKIACKVNEYIYQN